MPAPSRPGRNSSIEYLPSAALISAGTRRPQTTAQSARRPQQPPRQPRCAALSFGGDMLPRPLVSTVRRQMLLDQRARVGEGSRSAGTLKSALGQKADHAEPRRRSPLWIDQLTDIRSNRAERGFCGRAAARQNAPRSSGAAASFQSSTSLFECYGR